VNPGGNNAFLVKRSARNNFVYAHCLLNGLYILSIEQRRTEEVFAVIQELVANGKTTLRPGDVNAALRERNSPMGTWVVRAEFSHLESLGRITCDPQTGDWQLLETTALKDAG
jgi:hypothetical protein